MAAPNKYGLGQYPEPANASDAGASGPGKAGSGGNKCPESRAKASDPDGE